VAEASDTAPSETCARAIEVRGTVQGVGFRPFVWRLAQRFGVAGRVRNVNGVVQIRAEGEQQDVEAFCEALRSEAPPLAVVGEVTWDGVETSGAVGFEVDSSLGGAEGERFVPPDASTCPACLEELFDPNDRRYRYAFINCTDCGPRFTIIEDLPYDRERTCMSVFQMCEECSREYLDPANRRFHAEPVACPKCGPRLTLWDTSGRETLGDPIEAAAALLGDGKILALKGLGGFHLACSAIDDAAVSELRWRKSRPDKPFAVMIRDLEAARGLFDMSRDEEELLGSRIAPIVLVRDKGGLAPSVAPGHRRQGAMLPSTPLHHLLLRETDLPLVMTSGNLSEEPICIGNDEARERLGGLADAIMTHDREIVARYDDSVMLISDGRPRVFRRARSLAPSPVELPAEVAPVLGCGAELNATFCLASGRNAFLSQHIGDFDSEEAERAYTDALACYRRLFGIEPEAVAHDLHPDFLSTRFAERTGLPSVPVGHHHAHIAAVMAEHQLPGPVIGVAFDGFGLGDDGTAWGGEFLVCDWKGATRAGRLRQVRQPGGDAAVRDPARMALAHAMDAGVLEEAAELLGEGASAASVVEAQVSSGLGSPLTSSAGRLFDAVSALAGVCRLATYEGQPAMLLEQAAEVGAIPEYPFGVEDEGGVLVLDTRPMIAAIVGDLSRGIGPGSVAGRFHRTLVSAVLEICRITRGGTGIDTVCLSGGVFQNELLTSNVVASLAACGFQVFVSEKVPAGDGGISLGQVLVAHGKMEE